ncbi:helix-turn-helix domain-containing protein [Lysinibacillus sp. NPDC059133]|uniref:helix-turn-helix domain-containing protein n=1 Tax=Lysinibacillus sp. NPDC059133 TaxID=3346737 RepID=UPI0036B2E38A
MRLLLNKNLLRQLQFLEKLYERDGWITLSVIAQALNCSERVLRDDIKLINTEFKPFQIQTSQNGVMLTYPNHYSADFIYQKVLSLSPEFLFLERIFFEEKYDIETIANELFLSSSTMRRIIAKLNTFLNKYEIQIVTNPCKIIGNEQNIRSIMVHFFYEKYGVTYTPFEDTQIKVLDKLFLHVMQANHIQPNFPDLIRIKNWTMVNVIRLKNHHKKIVPEHFPNHLDLSIFDNTLFCEWFKDTFNLEFNKETVQQLFSALLNNQYAFNYETLERMIQQKINKAWIIVPKIDSFLHCLATKLNIPIQNKEKEKIILELYNLQTMNYGRSFILNDKRRLFSERFSHEFSYFVLFLKEELTKFQFHKEFKWTSNFFTETLYILIINWGHLLSALKSKVPILHVGIFCDADIEHTEFIQNIMVYQFGHLIKPFIIEELNLSTFREVSKNYDLIITNISGLKDISAPLICVNTIPLSHDLNKVQKEIFTLIHLKLSKEFE